MSKYWKPTMTPNYSPLFKRWQPDVSNVPRDGSFFLGRMTGTNQARAVRWLEDTTSEELGVATGFYDSFGKQLDICQWISFTDFADIRTCVWRQK